MSAIDRLLDMVTRDSVWSTTPAVVTYAKVEGTEEMRIIPDTPNGPILEVAAKNKDGVVLFSRRYNIAAIDDLIGRLIKMRDHMSNMESKANG